MTIPDVVNEFKEKYGKTQADLGRDLAVTKQAVSHWERGRSKPDLSYLINLTVIYSDWRRDFALRCIDTYNLAQERRVTR
jgi:DNA-binding XRE family transcriptional regulator